MHCACISIVITHNLLNIFVLELEYALKIRIFKKPIKIPDSLDFLGFLHTHFYVCHIHIFTDIKYVFSLRKWLHEYLRHTYEKYAFLRIPNLKIRIYTYVIRIFRFSG